MRLNGWETFQKLKELFRETTPSSSQMAMRLQAMERDIILPVKAVFVGILLYDLFFSRWFEDVTLAEYAAQRLVEQFALIYLTLNVGVASVLLLAARLPSPWVQWVIFISNFVDGLFLATITFVTGGFDSILYWLFLGLIVRNAVSCPRAVPQILLNFSASFCYLLGGILDMMNDNDLLDLGHTSDLPAGNPTEPFLLRLIVLWLMTLCCYGVQVLLEKQRQAHEEAREFSVRQKQLHSAGRLAAQIAHQIKNPLSIINNAAFSLQRFIPEDKPVALQQIQIIREEVERSDRIITKLMGYAQLAEGQVEKLNLADELEKALAEVFPPGAKYQVEIEKDYAPHLPPLLMQRQHLAEILINVLQNAREVLNGKAGLIKVSARPGSEHSIVVTISDNGEGIPKDRLEKVFRAYFSTKEKGSGLGLSIVRHNTEMYGGTVRVESELGKGSRFILHFPTRTFMKQQT